MLSKTKIEYFKKKLEEQKERLERDLQEVGKKNPDKKGDWIPSVPEDLNTEISDLNEISDVFEEMENRAAIEEKLEEDLGHVNEALGRIKRDTYGKCRVCKKAIPEARLEANPSADTCIEHAEA